MQAKRHYVSHAIVHIPYFGKSLESNLDHDQGMQYLKYYNYSTPMGGHTTGDGGCGRLKIS